MVKGLFSDKRYRGAILSIGVPTLAVPVTSIAAFVLKVPFVCMR